MAASSLSAFKELVATIEKSKNLIEEHELLSDEELNTLKQTSSLVAKFQKEALTEKENRVSAELQAREKDRLVSDAWKIVSALKKDKYGLELQLERLKTNRSVTRNFSNKRLSDEHFNKRTRKPFSKTKNISLTDNKEQPTSDENVTLSSDGIKTSNSSDSKEKQDSVKESMEDDLYGDTELTTQHRTANHMQELSSTGTEDEEAEVEVEEFSSDAASNACSNSFKHYSPSDIIKLWTAKPYASRRRLQGVDSKDTNKKSWYARKDAEAKCTEKARGNQKRTEDYRTHSKDSIRSYITDHSAEEDTSPSISLEDVHLLENIAARSDEDGSMGELMTSFRYHNDTQTYGITDSKRTSRSDSVRESLGNQGREMVTKEREIPYGRHAPKNVSPLVSHSLSSSNEAKPKDVRRSRDYINLLDIPTRENLMNDRSTRTGRKQARPAVKKLPKTDSHTQLITSPKGLPGGIVSKRIQDLAKRLKIGHSTAPSKKSESMPYSDYMDLRNPCPGLCGLENLGNSCFMNAGLQCLFVIKPFYRFFSEGGHMSLLKTKSNQQSTSLSVQLGRLIEKVFSGCYLTCEPSALFNCLQSRFPQLDGFRQHDCQEFLALFLDALHQELNTANRNLKRSIKQTDKSRARNADQWWRMYNEDNESVIVDTFQGQFRNKITCSECGHVSVTYQLFSFLSLPLVSQRMQSFIITFIHNNRTEPTYTNKPKAIRLRVQASKPSSTMQIKQRLISLLPEDQRPDFDNLFLAVVRGGAIVGLLHDERIVTPFNDKHTKLYAYEPLHPPIIGSTSDTTTTISTSDMNLHSNFTHNATATSQSHESSRRYIKEKNTLMVPLGNHGDTRGIEESRGNRDGRGRETRASLPVGYHLTYTCSVCLQVQPSKELLQHDECGKVFCRECLHVSIEEENIRCPDCTRPSSTGRNKELNLKYFNVPVIFRHMEPDSESDCTLFGHPNLVTLPHKLTGEDLYRHLATLLPVLEINKKTRDIQTLPFTLHLVNYQGRYCSRCDHVMGCTGCFLQEDDVLVLQNGDHIAIQLTNIIQLEIDKMSRYCDHESMRVKHLTCRLQLQDCLRSFVDREELQDLWPCPECNQERSATKSMSVVRYPDTLIVHLKRYNQNNMKVFTPVDFPLEDLDMSEFMHGVNSPRESYGTGDYIYDLVGCVCHDGDYEGGHYNAYTRHGIKAEWCLFDDYKVTKECPSSLSHKTVYLLFYNRRSGSPLSTSVSETITPTKVPNKSCGRRSSVEDKSKMGKPRKLKSLSSIDEINAPEAVVQKSQLEDVVDSNDNSTSTPKERLKKQTNSYGKTEGVTLSIGQEQEQPHSVTLSIGQKQEQRDGVTTSFDHQQEQSAQCDCSQCDYFRALEQQIKRCRRSISGTNTKESGEFGSVSSRGASPKAPKQTPPVKNTTPKKVVYETRIHKLQDKTPPLASSDSLGSELEDRRRITSDQTRRGHHQRPSRYSPTSTSSDPQTDVEAGLEADAEAEGSSDIKRSKRRNRVHDGEDDTDDYDTDDDTDESVTTKTTHLTDIAVQCSLLDEHDMEYGPDYDPCSSKRSNSKNKVNSAVKVSFTKPKYRRTDEEERSETHNVEEVDVEFLTRKLIYAVENEDIRYALQLLKEGASSSLLIDGVSAIHLSAGMISSLGFHFTRLFLDFGANPNVKSADGVTPVHVASMWGQKECLKLLLSKGGNPYSEDLEGHNAVELAKIFENDTSANTSEYLSKLDDHYLSLIRSGTWSNASLTSNISTSELQYMPYLYGEDDCRQRRARNQLAEFVIPRPEITTEGSTLPGCGSWTRRLKKKVKKNILVRTVSGNLRRTSSRLAGRFRSIGGHFSSDRHFDRNRQTDTDDVDSEDWNIY